LKRTATLAATLALLVAAVYFGRDGSQLAAPPAASPAECIERMFAAAERGDIEAYLDCFAGAELRRLSTERNAQPPERFAAALAESVRPLKGRAINGPSKAPDSDRAKLKIERIYEHHSERQTYAFRRDADGWRIDAIGPVERLQQAIPYGSPVYDLSPEAEAPTTPSEETAG
jgi:hypothetical protein